MMKKYFALSLTLLLSLPPSVFSTTLQTQTLKDARKVLKTAKKPKLAPDLEEMLAQDDQQALTL